ncbi:hypothetical protein L484_002308 [Morus notabilis]|uniref:Uncharacterized protein n=1 Tax=Morus notabilis TaxID=981085 RepID=W9SEJ0_9ROSA|nr:hypothetical protein L484_002308 [Morus notabilis]
MGRQSGDATTKVSSSIALLQERFRQLQKVKEKREEKELLKMLSESERASPTSHFDPSNLPFQSNNRRTVLSSHTHTPTTSRDQSLSLGLDLQATQADLNTASSATSSKTIDNSEIDTSLHL